MEGPGADSEEKRVLASDLDTVMVDSLKALDLIRPIREADIGGQICCDAHHGPLPYHCALMIGDHFSISVF